MARPSNIIITILNVLTLAMAILAIGFSMWLQIHPGNSSLCQKVLHKPLLYVGLALFVVSLLGLIGSCCRLSFFMWLYSAVLFLMILGLICFTMFTIIVTNKGVGKVLSKRGVQEYRLGDYSRWLQNFVVNAENWDEIKSCLVDVNFCRNIDTGKPPEFYQKGLPPIQSGCCKPPAYCGFESKNATFWTMPETGPAVPDADCRTWSNVQTQLCFDCQSCKTAFLDNIKKEWKTLAIINTCILVLVIAVYSVGCCALRNNRRSKGYAKHRGGYL
nr:tetraspanin-8 [Coffea arabica]